MNIRFRSHAWLLRTATMLSVVLYAAPALAIAQDKPITIDSIKAVCTGIGESKNDHRWNNYPVKLIFANQKGQYTAGEKIDIKQNGHAVLQTSCDAPWLLLKPKAGNYRVIATLSGPAGQRQTGADFSAKGAGAHQTITLDFPTARAG